MICASEIMDCAKMRIFLFLSGSFVIVGIFVLALSLWPLLPLGEPVAVSYPVHFTAEKTGKYIDFHEAFYQKVIFSPSQFSRDMKVLDVVLVMKGESSIVGGDRKAKIPEGFPSTLTLTDVASGKIVYSEPIEFGGGRLRINDETRLILGRTSFSSDSSYAVSTKLITLSPQKLDIRIEFVPESQGVKSENVIFGLAMFFIGLLMRVFTEGGRKSRKTAVQD